MVFALFMGSVALLSAAWRIIIFNFWKLDETLNRLMEVNADLVSRLEKANKV